MSGDRTRPPQANGPTVRADDHDASCPGRGNARRGGGQALRSSSGSRRRCGRRCPWTLRGSRRRSTSWPRRRGCRRRSGGRWCGPWREPAVMHARVFGAAPLTEETLIGSFVEGARVRAEPSPTWPRSSAARNWVARFGAARRMPAAAGRRRTRGRAGAARRLRRARARGGGDRRAARRGRRRVTESAGKLAHDREHPLDVGPRGAKVRDAGPQRGASSTVAFDR